MQHVTVGGVARQHDGAGAAVRRQVVEPFAQGFVVEQFGAGVEGDDVLDRAFAARGDATDFFRKARREGFQSGQVAARDGAHGLPGQALARQRFLVDANTDGDAVGRAAAIVTTALKG